VSDVVNPAAPRGEQTRTRNARRAVVEAARHLFTEDGYARTTVTAISRRAGVPEPTVYRLFSSKVGILQSVLDVSIAGDDEPVPVAERPAVSGLLDGGDAGTVLAGFAAVTTEINRRSTDLFHVLSRAADANPEAAALFARLLGQRDAGQGVLVRALHERGLLRDGLTADRARDVVHALMAPEVYRLLVVDRGWSPEEYRDWAAATLVQQLT
jgi:AcrR family transcriptional regulator